MVITKVSILICLVVISIHAHHEEGHEHDENTGRGSVEQVNRGRSVQTQTDTRSMPIMEYIYAKCKDKKAFCFGDMDNCHQSKCKYMTAIEKVGSGYHFHLVYKDASLAQNPNGYVAVGLSTEGVAMKDVAIIACQGDPAPHRVEAYWSTDKKTSAINKVTTSDIIVSDTEKFKFYGNETTMACEFVLKPSFTIKINNKPYSFDLDKKKYKILLAIGLYDENSENEIKLKYHQDNRRLSTELFSLGLTDGSKAGRSSCCMHLPSFSIIALLFTCIITKVLTCY